MDKAIDGDKAPPILRHELEIDDTIAFTVALSEGTSIEEALE